MANNSESLPLKILWQAILVAALVLGAWVLGQILPTDKKATPPAAAAAVSTTSPVLSFALPKPGDGSALAAINERVAAAQKEIIVVARQVAALSLLTNLQQRQEAGIRVITLLSSDMTADFGNSKLSAWMRSKQFKGVYKDTLASASHLIIIDRHTVVVSDLPFSQRAYEPAALDKDSVLGFTYIIDDAKLAEELIGNLKPRVSAQNKLL